MRRSTTCDRANRQRSARQTGIAVGLVAITPAAGFAVSLLPKMEIEVVVLDHLSESVVAAIIKAARTGEIGDGRVFVMPVTRSHRIRTGEEDPA